MHLKDFPQLFPTEREMITHIVEVIEEYEITLMRAFVFQHIGYFDLFVVTN